MPFFTVGPGCPLGQGDGNQDRDEEKPVPLPRHKGGDPGDCSDTPIGFPQLQSPSRRKHASVWNSVYFLNSADITFFLPLIPLPPSIPLSLFLLTFFLPQFPSLASLRLQVSAQPCKEFHYQWSPENSPRRTWEMTSLLMNESERECVLLFLVA